MRAHMQRDLVASDALADDLLDRGARQPARHAPYRSHNQAKRTGNCAPATTSAIGEGPIAAASIAV